MTVYIDFDFILYNVKNLCSSFDIYIHIDKKSSPPTFFLNELESFDNVFVCSEYRINWGSIRHVEAVLDLLRTASERGYKRYIIMGENISSLYSPEDLCRFFDENKNKNYMEMKPIEVAGRERVDNYHFLHLYNIRDWSIIGKLITFFWSCVEGVARKFGIKHKLKYEYPYKGYLYCALNDKAVKHIFSDENKLTTMLAEMKYFYVPEEHFFQNILLDDKELADSIVPDSLIFDIWDEPERGMPAYIEEGDIERAKNSSKLFLRKMGAKNLELWQSLFRYSMSFNMERE